MSYFVCLSLFLLFQANYGLIDEEELVQKLLDVGSPTDEALGIKSADYECVFSKYEGVSSECPDYNKPTSTDTLTKSDWKKACRDQYDKLECVHRKLNELCEPSEVTEYLKKHYNNPPVYACYYCKDYVDYLQENFNATVQQVDENNNEIPGLTCRVNETAGEDCVTKLADPLIATCSKHWIGPDPDEAKCVTLKCTDERIEAICGENKAMEYWQELPPKATILEIVNKWSAKCVKAKEIEWQLPIKSEWQTELQFEWELKCRDMYINVSCFYSSLMGYCADFTNGSSHVLEDIMKENEMPKVFACAYCQRLVDYVYENLSLTLQQIDDEGNILEGLACPVTETKECATVNAAPLIVKYNSTANKTFDSDQYRSRANCEDSQLISGHIEAICGTNATIQYWKDNPPKVHACYYCRNFVDYIRRYIRLEVQQTDDKGEVVEGFTCPVVQGDSQCLNNRVTLHFIEKCEGTFKLANTYNITSKKDCEIMNKLVPCCGKNINAICGQQRETEFWISKVFWRKPSPLKVYACWYCNEMVDYLGIRNVRVQQPDVDNLPSSVSCPLSQERENCAEINAEPFADQCQKKLNDVQKDVKKNIEDAKKFCRILRKSVECTYNTVEPICGNESASKYIGNTTKAIDISFCPYCNAAIDYMENLGVHLARKDEGHCRKDDCEISSLTEVINQTCTFEDNTPYEKLCSDMYSATLCANDTVVTKCGDLFGDDYMRRNYTPPNVYPCWHCQQMTKYMSKFNKTVQQRDANKSHDNPLGTTCPLNFTSDCAEKNAQPMIQDCKNKQIPSNLSFFADPAHSKNVCRSIYESVKCIHERVSDVCGEKVANETIKTMEFKTLADNCAYCTEAINITEKYGGRLKIESDSGPSEYCVRPDCTKRQLTIALNQSKTCNWTDFNPQTSYEYFCRDARIFAECAYNFAKDTCYEDRATEYMRDEFEIKVYPCADCTELIEFMGKHDGKVYQADKNNNPVVVRSVNMTCPVGRDECYGCPKSNAKNFVDECKKVFYEATSFGHSNESVGVEYCSALQVMLKCVHDEVKAICGHSETKRYMKSEMYPEVRGDMCEDCIKSVAFMEGFGGHVYIRDLPAGAVCKLHKTIVKKKPISSAKSYYASGFYVHILSLLYLFMYSVLQVL